MLFNPKDPITARFATRSPTFDPNCRLNLRYTMSITISWRATRRRTVACTEWNPGYRRNYQETSSVIRGRGEGAQREEKEEKKIIN